MLGALEAKEAAVAKEEAESAAGLAAGEGSGETEVVEAEPRAMVAVVGEAARRRADSHSQHRCHSVSE